MNVFTESISSQMAHYAHERVFAVDFSESHHSNILALWNLMLFLVVGPVEKGLVLYDVELSCPCALF